MSWWKSKLLWAGLSLLSLLGMALVLSRASAQAQNAGQAAPGSAAAGQAPAKADPLPMPVEEIIRRFAQHESDFRTARGNYTYSQSVLVQEAMPDGGEYRMESDIVFTPAGRRYEEVTFAPANTLRYITLSPEDQKDLEDIQPFVLTAEELSKYDVEYVGREQVDELHTYVFRVAPKRIEKKQRYFQGSIWVDDRDLAVVKSYGKAVPDVGEQQFPKFTTYRENVEANFWFPTYTHADDILRFKSGDVHIRMTVRYKNYKRFGSTIKLGQSRPVETPPANPQPAPQK